MKGNEIKGSGKEVNDELIEVLETKELCCFFKRRQCDWLMTIGRKYTEQGGNLGETAITDPRRLPYCYRIF